MQRLRHALICAPALLLGACYISDKSNDESFPNGKFCFSSKHESLEIDNGKLSSLRGRVDGVPVSLHYGAKTGDRFIYIDGVQLRFDEIGEFIAKGKTSIDLWRYGHKSREFAADDISVSTMQEGYVGASVTFKQVAC